MPVQRNFRSLLPFSNAHWILPLILWLLWAYQLISVPCAEGAKYFVVALLTATVCIALWSNHSQIGPTDNFKSIAKVMAGALYDVLLLLLWLFPIVLIVPTYDCYTPRAKVLELFALSQPLVTEIERLAKQHGSLSSAGTGLKVKPGKYLSGGIVSEDGTIIEISENPPAVIMLVPNYSNGIVIWKCTGFPKEYMPKDSCN